MKLIRCCLLAVLVAAGCQQDVSARLAAPPSATNALPSGAIQLWNGRDLTGWKTFFTNSDLDVSSVWSARGGVLSLAGKPTGYLYTERSFANYHVHAEWRWPQADGNSGLFVHATGNPAIWPASVECQLKNGSAGELIGQGGVKFPAPVISGRNRAKIAASSEKAVGEWNQMDVYCRGDTIEVQVNGVRQNLVKSVSVSQGAIGLQLEGFPIELRRIWLQPL